MPMVVNYLGPLTFLCSRLGYSPHFTDEEPEAQRGLTWPRLHSCLLAELGINPDSLVFTTYSYADKINVHLCQMRPGQLAFLDSLA